jgi:hypothetical protein
VSEFSVRTMRRGELDWAMEQMAREGWNPGLHDAEAFFAADPEGFFIALRGEEPVGAISAVRYDAPESPFGFIGCYLVVPEHRAEAPGLLLARAAMRRLAGYNIGQDGVFENVEKYARLGFTLAYRNLRQRYVAPATVALPDLPPELRITALSEIPFAQVCDYDRTCFPARRDGFLKHWLTMPGATALAGLNGNQLAGFGMIRPCQEGYKIGPLFADDATAANGLFRKLCHVAKAGENIYLDTPEPNVAAMAMAEQYGMETVFGTARMYSRFAPDLDLNRIFGVTTFELG